MDERTVTPHNVVFSLLLWLLFLLRASNKQTDENRSSNLLVCCLAPRIWRWQKGMIKGNHIGSSLQRLLSERKKGRDKLAIKSYRELIRKITHDWFLWGIFPPAAKCFFCFDKWPRRNCFQRIILSVKLPKPKRAYAAFIISTIQALFELNSDMRHGLETATWDGGNGDTENDTKTNWTCDSNKESANRVVKYRQRHGFFLKARNVRFWNSN